VHLSHPACWCSDCLQTKIQAAGGQFAVDDTYIESAYRNPEYQSHIDEIWSKWQQLKDNATPECADVKAYVDNEVSKHKIRNLGTRPASRSGPHPQGIAVDIVIPNTGLPLSTVVNLADQCNISEPLAARGDPNHFVLRPPK